MVFEVKRAYFRFSLFPNRYRENNIKEWAGRVNLLWGHLGKQGVFKRKKWIRKLFGLPKPWKLTDQNYSLNFPIKGFYQVKDINAAGTRIPVFVGPVPLIVFIYRRVQMGRIKGLDMFPN